MLLAFLLQLSGKLLQSFYFLLFTISGYLRTDSVPLLLVLLILVYHRHKSRHFSLRDDRSAVLRSLSLESGFFPDDFFPEDVKINSFEERVFDDFTHDVVEGSIGNINGMLKVVDDLSGERITS